jgi:hypothetical protein
VNKHVSAFVLAALLVASLLSALPTVRGEGAAGQGASGAAVPQFKSPLYLPLVGATLKRP